MRKFWQTLAAIILAVGGGVGISSATPAVAMSKPAVALELPDGAGHYRGAKAWFWDGAGPYTYIRVVVMCTGSGAYHYGTIVSYWATSHFQCWPGTTVTAAWTEIW